MNYSIRLIAGSCLLSAAALAAAQPANPASSPGASGLDYRSAFADYKPYRDISPGDWKSLNGTVGEGKGASAATPMSDAKAPPAMPAMPAMKGMTGMTGSGGHKMPGGMK